MSSARVPLHRPAHGVQSLSAVHGLGATLELLLSIGPEVIEQRALQLSRELAEGLENQGFTVVSSMRERERSGILSAQRDGIDVPTIQKTLVAERVACASREGRVRVSPQFYNTPEEVAKCLACLPK